MFQIDYKGFRPSGKAMLTMENPEHLAKNLRALSSLHICGVKVRPVAHYSPDSTYDPEDPDKGVTGNGPEGNFPYVERNVVLWGMPGKTTVEEIAMALADFKTEHKKDKPIIVKLEKCVNFFLRAEARFILIFPSLKACRKLYIVFALRRHNGFSFRSTTACAGLAHDTMEGKIHRLNKGAKSLLSNTAFLTVFPMHGSADSPRRHTSDKK
ncbi:hypothetical protein C0992_010173 [Termitomyces sp. T32_za158]|nr:hypothetical protein C0992_010173 [Termitomyces sp. T32_za158]